MGKYVRPTVVGMEIGNLQQASIFPSDYFVKVSSVTPVLRLNEKSSQIMIEQCLVTTYDSSNCREHSERHVSYLDLKLGTPHPKRVVEQDAKGFVSIGVW